MKKGAYHHSEEAKAKISLANKGRIVNAEGRRNISIGHIGLVYGPCPEERKRKISAANKGRTLSEESRRNISLGHIGLRPSPEECKRRSERMKGRTLSLEHRRKISEGRTGKGHPNSPETLLKIKESRKGYHHSYNTRLKIGRANKGKHQSLEARRKASEKLKGNTWVKIYGEEGARLFRIDVSARMKANNPRKYLKRPSGPQMQLFNYLKTTWPELEMEYHVKCDDDVHYYLDIAYPSAMIDFEYDGSYFHQDKNKDRLRDERLSKAGWTVIRYVNEDLKSMLRGE